jgi:hypothetical protein
VEEEDAAGLAACTCRCNPLPKGTSAAEKVKLCGGLGLLDGLIMAFLIISVFSSSFWREQVWLSLACAAKAQPRGFCPCLSSSLASGFWPSLFLGDVVSATEGARLSSQC